jgi:hypothetical protein
LGPVRFEDEAYYVVELALWIEYKAINACVCLCSALYGRYVGREGGR